MVRQDDEYAGCVRGGDELAHDRLASVHLDVDQVSEPRFEQRLVQRAVIGIGDRLVPAFGPRAERHDQRLALRRDVAA